MYSFWRISYLSGRYLYTVYIISDSYIGFDQQYDVQLEVIPGQKKNDQMMEYDFPKLIWRVNLWMVKIFNLEFSIYIFLHETDQFKKQ